MTYAPFLLGIDQAQPVLTLPDHQVSHKVTSTRQEAHEATVHVLNPSSVLMEERRIVVPAWPSGSLPFGIH